MDYVRNDLLSLNPERNGGEEMARRWSKLQKQLYDLIDDRVPLQVHCIGMDNLKDKASIKSLGVFRVHLGRRIIWDFPKGVLKSAPENNGQIGFSYSVSDINELVREYIDTPKDELLEKLFPGDRYGLTDILKAADRRLGRERLNSRFDESGDGPIRDILNYRFGQK
jgi:hypothetical protein